MSRKLDFLNLFLIILLPFLQMGVYARASAEISSADAERQIAETETTAEMLGKQWNADAIKQSIALYLTVFDYRRKNGEFERASDCLRNISASQITLGNNDAATDALQQARQFDLRYDNPSKNIKTFSLLATAFLRLGKMSQALKFSEQVRQIAQTVKTNDAQAIAFFTEAQINYDKGEFNTATENYEKALIYWRKADNLSEQSRTLFELSYTYLTNDKYQIGLAKAQESLAVAEQINDLQAQVLAANAIAVLRSNLGQKQAALEIFLQSEGQFPDNVNSLDKGSMFNHLAGIYYDLDDLQSALKYRLKALEIFQKEKHQIAQLNALSKLGIITYELGDEQKGLEYFETGFKLARKLKSDYYYSVIAQDLGELYFKKDKSESLKYLQIALRNFQKLKIKTHIALVQNNIGAIYQSQKKNDIAAKYFDSALRLNLETKNRFAESQNLFNLASIEFAKSDLQKALNLSKQSIEAVESISTELLNAKLKSTYFSNIFDRYELNITLLMDQHKQSSDENYAIQALQAAEKSRARSMLENLSLAGANFIKDASPEIIKREKEIRILLNAKADKLTDLLSRNADKSEIEKFDNEINTLEHEREEIKANLKQNSPIYSAIKNPAPFDVNEFQRDVLDENSLLLEFSFGKEESYLWLVSKTEVNSYILPPREQIESRVENLRKLIDSRGMLEGETVESYQARISEAENTYKIESKQLSDELFGQIADKLSNKRLIIVPDGKLHYFPVAALPFPNSSDNQPILLTNEVVYEPSAATLALLMRNGRKTSAATKNLLVFSDPIFSNQDARIANTANVNEIQPVDNSLKVEKFRFAESLTSLARLNASKDEANSIIGIVGASDSTTFSGAAATRERVLDASIGDYKIIHFATHGLIKEDRPELSGIVLSQIDESGQAINGVVRLQDIYAMNLSADAVVLSACSTGIGKEVKGEGMMSLSNAFLQTGAKSVVSSLWKVDDYAAQELMKDFYRELSSGTATTAEALRKAQIKMRRNPQYQSPFYWAAFTVEGDFQNVPQFSGGTNYKLYGLLMLPFAMIAFYFYRRRFK